MIEALFTWLGVDFVQWRALAGAYLRMDFRASGGAVTRHGRRRTNATPLAGILIVSGIGGIAFGLLAAGGADALLTASLLTTYAAATTTMMLLVDFTGLVVSPDDYRILGYRPVGSRTYFAARFSAIAVYVAAISVAIAVVPAVAYGARLGLVAAPATIAAVLACDLSAAVLVVTTYALLVEWISPARLRRVMTYVQLAGSMAFYLVYWLSMSAYGRGLFEGSGFERSSWIWAVPTTWYAAGIAWVGSPASRSLAAATAAAAVVTLACIPLGAGRLSLEYARRIGEASAASEPAGRRRPSRRLPGFSRGEARAVALLVRAQFRHDQRFRMAVLAILPLTVFYVLMGLREGALRDPFLNEGSGNPGVFFAIVFIPMTLHTALSTSESWRAAWIFFVAPASHARIVVAAKNFVSLYFVGVYVALLAALWSAFYERVWHAVVHALFAGLLAHLLLQFAVIAKPALPFAAEPGRTAGTAGLFGVLLVGGIFASLFPLFAFHLYQSTALTLAALGFLIAASAVVEYALRLRVAEAIGDLEFRS
jgi:hypothetical protein